MNATFTTRFACSFVLIALLSAQTNAAEPIPGIGPTGEAKRLHTNLQFTEGPASDGQGNLYFTDIPANRIYKHDAQGKRTLAIEPSRTANGLMFDADGLLIVCEMEGAIVGHDLKSGKRIVLAGEHKGKRFNAPNDLVIDRTGGIYFTDPRFRAPQPFPQEKEAFYYRAPDGQVTRLGENQNAPNGVILSPDEKTLYIICSMQKEILAFPVESPGKIGAGRTFATLKQPEGKDNTGGDGLTIDTKGNLYITSHLGIQVFSPEGKHLGLIQLPEQPSNATFGGPDNKTLYVTARTSLYQIPMEAQGHVFTGQVERK